ncbi:galanin receptor type 1-like [Acanthaster planci]|uniref:Galanin receptor type 1-like n=1 Tax=Acanthaster planci TaxID=133434 RepID=A0A8B7XFU9_ACAPL|nr:galanin receptor type 1-like [Acanthaster planci]XP_022079649.1 galanin receptor type 1-like [Acanthaster planci]
MSESPTSMDGNMSGEFANSTLEPDIGGLVPNKHLFIAIFCIFCVFGVIGNGSLVFLVIRFPHLRTMPNILMINLTIGDLLFIVSTLPIIIQMELGVVPQYETVGMCKFVNFFPVFGKGVTVLSMMTLSVERYCAIVHGLEMRSMRTSRRVLGAMIFIWGMTFLISLPVLITAGFLYEGNEDTPKICADMYIGEPGTIAYVSVQITLLYILPLLVMGFCYTSVAVILTKGAHKTNSNSRSSTNYKARKRLAIAMIIMAVFFGVFWFPVTAFSLYFQVHFKTLYELNDSEMAAFQFFRRCSRVFAYTNSCFNPWILYFISTTHRRAIARCLCSCGGKDADETGGYRMVRMRNNGRTVTTFHSYTSESGTNRTHIKAEDI